MHRRFKYLLAGALLLAFAAAVFLAREQGDKDEAPVLAGEPVEFVDGPLETSNRTTLSICVDAIAGATLDDGDLDTVRRALEGAFSAVRGTDLDEPEFADPEVVAGCPAPQMEVGRALTPFELLDQRWTGGPTYIVGDGRLPSEHRVFVYVVPREVYTITFGSEAQAGTHEESLCPAPPGDVCQGVTSGLYLPAPLSEQALQRGIAGVFGLAPPEAAPTDPQPTRPPVADIMRMCDEGTPTLWCGKYRVCKLLREEHPAAPTNAECQEWYDAEAEN